jgi:glycosyltransferase involved in cell wall biosynthesis
MTTEATPNDSFDSYSIRKPECVRVNNGEKLTSETARVTVGIVSADIKSEYAAKCIDSIKQYTSNYDLIILDNNRGPNFNHPREMNRIISVAKTDYLVLMDDDVFVEEGWLNGLFGALSPDVGVVTPLHKDKNGELSYSGVFLMLNGTGEHAHIIDIPSEARSIPTLCSAIMLIDLNKCRYLLFNERNRKYFLDIDYGLQVWEAGYRVVCTPETTVTHIGGGTLTQGSSDAMVLHKIDEDIFIEDWIKSDRLKSIEDGIWQRDVYVKSAADLSKEVLGLLDGVGVSDDLSLLMSKIEQVLSKCDSFPYLRQKLSSAYSEILKAASLSSTMSK